MTAKDLAEAKKIAGRLLEKKLIACANFFPVESMYSWKGKVVEAKECIILAKTTDSGFERIEKEVKAMHGYDVPAIYSWKADKVSRLYSDWVNKEVKP